ncbi:MAG: alcohol dehydrogenase catalytic domain-containing protein [Microcella sp.]
MKAWQLEQYGGAEALRLVDIADAPAPKAGQVTIEIAAVAIESASLHLMTGEPRAVRLALGWSRPRRPLTPGVQAAGAIVAVGAGVEHFAVGDRVAGFIRGGLTERVTVRANRVARIPDALDLAAAATLPVSAGTALATARALALLEPRSATGMHVAVIGAAGSVGAPLTALLARAGAEVTAVARASAAEYVRSLGANAVIDYRSTPTIDEWGVFDVVIDLADGRPVSALRHAVTPSGTLAIVGADRGGGALLGPASRQLHAALLNPLSRRRLIAVLQSERAADIETLARLTADGELPRTVADTVKFDVAPDGYAAFARGGAGGTLVVTR